MDAFSNDAFSKARPIKTETGEWLIATIPASDEGTFPDRAAVEAPDLQIYALRPIIDPHTKHVTGFSPYRITRYDVNSTYAPIPTESLPQEILEPLFALAEDLKPKYEQALAEGKGIEGHDYDSLLTEQHSRKWRDKIQGGSLKLEQDANQLAQDYFEDLSSTEDSLDKRMAAIDRKKVYNETTEYEYQAVTKEVRSGLPALEEYLQSDDHSPEAAAAIIDTHNAELLIAETEQTLKSREDFIGRITERGLGEIEHMLGKEANSSHIKTLQERRQRDDQGPRALINQKILPFPFTNRLGFIILGMLVR